MTHSTEIKTGIQVVGIDLAKNSFHVFAVDSSGKKVLSKSFTREKLKAFFINLPACTVAMEACGSAHYWGRLIQSYGHEVKLISPQFVKPYVKSNKNDAADAEAICEAVQRPTMRFVALKSPEQQDIQALHRMRSLAVSQRTAKANQIRGLLGEYGIVMSTGIMNLRKKIPLLLEDAQNGLSALFRRILSQAYSELVECDSRIEFYSNEINQIADQNEQAKRLQTIPGIGPIIASALIAAIGSVESFKNGRELAAWLGLVPRQHSTGGKSTLLGISKRGDAYLRSLLIHGARASMKWIDQKEDARSVWVQKLSSRRNKNIAIVALANKMARTAYALLKNGEDYRTVQAA